MVAPDKFRDTLSAREAADAMAQAATDLGAKATTVPLSDGGEGFLEVMGGPNRSSTVTGPLGDPVEVGWRLSRRVAVIESASAAGLALVGSAGENDPLAADTTGVGELIGVALDAGARRVVVGLGGSATTDGGLGAIRALGSTPRLRGVRLDVACDVRCGFREAAAGFAPQKGATDAQVELLERRLDRLAQLYREEFGVDVDHLARAGAAGGLAGGLAALGGNLLDGFSLVADYNDLDAEIETADVVLTGEGALDAASFDGKVVGGVLAYARSFGVPVGAIVGDVDPGVDIPNDLEVACLVADHGSAAARDDAAASVRASATRVLTALIGGSGGADPTE